MIRKKRNRSANMAMLATQLGYSKNPNAAINIMRIISIIGIALAIAALIVASSVGQGFENEYVRALLNFNSHVVIMDSMDIPNSDRIDHALNEMAYQSESESKFARHWQWLLPYYHQLDEFYEWLKLWQYEQAFALRGNIEEQKHWAYFRPAVLALLLPDTVHTIWHMLETISQKGVEYRAPFIYRETLIIANSHINGIIIKGIPEDMWFHNTALNIHFFDVDPNENQDKHKMPLLLGNTLFNTLGKPSTVRILQFHDQKMTFVKGHVVGTFATGMHDYDTAFAMMPIQSVRTLFNIPSQAISGMEIQLDNPFKARNIADYLDRRLDLHYVTMTWQQLNQDLLAAITMEQQLSLLIMGIMVCVSALNVITVLTLLLLYRLNHMSILQAIGLSRTDLISLFTRIGMQMVYWGLFLGSCIGLGICFLLKYKYPFPLDPELYLIDHLPIDISVRLCFLVLAICLSTGYLASHVAAKRLSKVPIIEGLKQAR